MRPHFISTVLTSNKHSLLYYWSNSEVHCGLVSLCANNGIILCLHYLYFILHFQNTFSKWFAHNCVNTYTNAVNGSQNKLTLEIAAQGVAQCKVSATRVVVDAALRRIG